MTRRRANKLRECGRKGSALSPEKVGQIAESKEERKVTAQISVSYLTRTGKEGDLSGWRCNSHGFSGKIAGDLTAIREQMTKSGHRGTIIY